MDTLAKLVKKRKLAKICRVGVWIIAIIGLIHVISQTYTLWHEYFQASPDIFVQSSPAPQWSTFLEAVPTILANAAIYLFYCIILYAASVVFESLSTPAAESKIELEPEKLDFDDESIVYTSLKPEEVRQGKNRIANNAKEIPT